MKNKSRYKGKTVRYESFGGIIGIHDPPALIYVDHEFMKNIGYEHSPLWENPIGYLSAPTEVHFNITGKCPMNCRHCTSDSREWAGSSEMSTEEMKKAVDVLADMKVFHIAFGGGELFSRQDAIEIAEYACKKGLVPNATTNGFYMTPELARQCRVFGQINVSLDGIGEDYGVVRGVSGFKQADEALRMLVGEGVNTGINCVTTRANFDSLKEVVAYADNLGLKEVLFLRLKPSGRAKAIYHDFKLTHDQNKEFFPFLISLAKKYKPNIQVDCSFIPNLCFHRPSRKIMALFGVEGCEGGSILLGLKQDGRVNACSHYSEYIENIFELNTLWHKHSHFDKFRSREITDKNCLSCKYSKICRGGCPLFSEFLTGDFDGPDPECPVLVEKRRK